MQIRTKIILSITLPLVSLTLLEVIPPDLPLIISIKNNWTSIYKTAKNKWAKLTIKA